MCILVIDGFVCENGAVLSEDNFGIVVIIVIVFVKGCITIGGVGRRCLIVSGWKVIVRRWS